MKKEVVCGIYKITSPSGGVYIGQSRNCEERWYRYRRGEHLGQRRLSKSFLKYGVSEHLFEVIHRCLPSELDYWEEYYIDKYNSFNTEKGMNLVKGTAANGIRSSETRVKNSLATKLSYDTGKKQRPCGNKNPMYGKGYKLLGKNNGRYGKPVSKETREKISIANILYVKENGGRKQTEEQKFKKSIAHVLRHGRNGSIGKYYGVYQAPRKSRVVFNCYIRVSGKRKYVGLFLDERDAAAAFNDAQLRYWGKIVYFNNV